MKVRLIVLIIICGIVLYKFVKSIFVFTMDREAAKLIYLNLINRTDGDSLYKMAVLSLLLFKHKNAFSLFQQVNEMIIENSFEPTVFEKKFLKFNMNYCYFPLPWIKEPKDLKCNYINHIFFRVFGRYHSPYYKGIGEDINSAIKKGFA